MLVMGEAGVGKSRLVAAAADAVTQAGAVVLTGWCLPLSGDLPFLPVFDLLRALGEVEDGRLLKDALGECPPFVAGEVSRFAPGLGLSPDQPPSDEPDDGWRKQRLFDGLARLFDAAARLRRVAVLIEDVHWADSTTLELLDYLLSPAHADAVAVVLTCRADEVTNQALLEWLERIHRNRRVRRMDLAPLSEAETGEQIALLLGGPTPDTFAKKIFSRSEGNAFFTEQLVAAGAEQGEELSPGLTSLLLSRVDQVTGAARHVLTALAVAARPLDEGSLGQVCDQPVPLVRKALQVLLTARLLRRPDSAGRYQLRHALLADVVNADLLAGVRVELHTRVADMMAAWDEPAVGAEVAEHLAAAGRYADELRWRVIAARHADSVFAAAEAAGQWQRAIKLSEHVPVGSLVEGMSLAQLYGAAEDALTLAGDDEAAGQLAEQALHRLADADQASRADVLRRAGNARGIASPERGLDLLYQALTIYEQLPPSPGQVKTMKELAGILHNAGRPDNAREFIDRGAEVAERAGLQYPLFEFRCVQAMYESRTGDPEAALRRIEALRDDLTEADGASPYIWVAIFHAGILYNLGRLDEIERASAPALRMASDQGMGSAFKTAQVRGNLVEALFELGATEAAARWVEPLTQGTASLSATFDYASRARVEMLRGNLGEAKRRSDEIDQLPASTLAFQAGTGTEQAELELWRGEADAALERAESLLARLAEAGQSDCDAALLVLGLRACADLAEQARSRRDAEALGAVMSSAARLSELRGLITPDPFTTGPFRLTATADHASWQAESSRLHGNSDPAVWELAATEWHRLTRPHRAAYARWRRAQALLAEPGRRTTAAAALRTAADEATQHVPLLTAIRELARRARIDLSEVADLLEVQQTQPNHPFALTERELAVLRLLVEGKTNSEIGAALFISQKTVSVHVTHIMRKLDVTSRVQAATVAERTGLLVAD